jgi:CheY-like chemotaxis protein
MKALVVDDDISIQTMIDALLTRHGVDVDPAFDGTEALIRLRNRTYDAIVLDLLLPETNGFETVRHLHIIDPGLLQRVIFMTAASERTLQFFDRQRSVVFCENRSTSTSSSPKSWPEAIEGGTSWQSQPKFEAIQKFKPMCSRS